MTKLMRMVHRVVQWPTRNQRNGNQTRQKVTKTHNFAKILFPEILHTKKLLKGNTRTSCSRRMGPSKRTESMKGTSTNRGDVATRKDRARILRPLSCGQLICHDRVTWKATRALTPSSACVKSPVDRFTFAFWVVALDDRETAEPRSCMSAFSRATVSMVTRSVCRDTEKSLARPGRKQANISVRMARISFGVLPCRKNNLMTACVSMLLKSRASLICFRACFLPGRAKDLSAARY